MRQRILRYSDQMEETAGPSVDKRLVYLGLMMTTLAYPLVALTLIVKTQNDYDDEGYSISPPHPQVTCPVEGAEGDIDCVPSPLAYAHIDTIMWVLVVNEVILHFTYVLYTKLWATAGIVFGFWREILSIFAFLAPELTFNSFVYYLQAMPFMRKLIPSLKTNHLPLLVCFAIGAILSTLYGLGTAQTTDQFRRAVTLGGPGIMFLFVDWFSRSVFLPFFELMQNTFTQLKVNTFLLAIFELVLTNLYGSLFLPLTHKLCVVLARFFYNVSYGVDSKVSLYDYVNLKPTENGLDPSDPLSKRTTLVSPKDIGTYEPDVCRSSISTLTKRKHCRGRSHCEGIPSSTQSEFSEPIDIAVRHEASPQRASAARQSQTNVALVGISQDGASGTKGIPEVATTQKRNDKAGGKRGGRAAEPKQGEATLRNKEHTVGPKSGMHRKGNPENNAKRDIEKKDRTGSNEAMRGERRQLPEQDEVEKDTTKRLGATGEKKGAGGRKKPIRDRRDSRNQISPAAGNESACVVDVEVSRPDRTLRPSVDHFLSAPQWSEVEGDNPYSEDSPANNENACSSIAGAEDDARQVQRPYTHVDNQPGQIDERSLAMAADAEDDALEKEKNSYIFGAVTEAVAYGKPQSGEKVCPGTSEANYSNGIAKIEGGLEQEQESFHPAKPPSRMQENFQHEIEPTDVCAITVQESGMKHNRRPSGTPRPSSSHGATLKKPSGICEVVGSQESFSGRRRRSSNRVIPMSNVHDRQIMVENVGDYAGTGTQIENCHRESSSMQRPVADEHDQEPPRTITAAGGGYVEEHYNETAHVKRNSQVEADCAREDKRGSVAEEYIKKANRKRQSQVGADYRLGREGADAGDQTRKAHRKRQSQLEADDRGALGYDEDKSRRAHRKRQSQVEVDDAEGYDEDRSRRANRKRQSQVEVDDAERRERDYHGDEPVRRGRGKRQSQIETGYEAGREYDFVGEHAKRNHNKRQSQTAAREDLEREYSAEQGRRAPGKRQSEAYGEGGRGAQDGTDFETVTGAPRDGKGAENAKAVRKHKKGGKDEMNDVLPEAAKPAGAEAMVSDADDPRMPEVARLSNPGYPNVLPPTGPKNGKGDGSEIDSVEQLHPKSAQDAKQPFRSNIYIPYRKGFGSDAVEFEKILTWFNMIWDSWRFLLLRTVMVKASNVFIFAIMVFKDYIYSMWHFCLRYDERAILTSLELHSIKSQKNKRIVKALGWFQALVVRPFFMPTCLATTTWRTQLLFGLNAQKAQSRMRGVAVIRYSKRKDFGLRTLSNISDNAPLDSPNEPTPQKAVRGCGVMLKTFFKDLGHDIAAHFRVEMELAATGLRGHARPKSHPHFSRKSISSIRDDENKECDVAYQYGSELVVIRNVPITKYVRGSRSSASFSSRSRSTSGSDHRRTPTRGKRNATFKSMFRHLMRTREDSAFKRVHFAWIMQVVEELQSLVFNRTWPRLLQKLMSSLSLVASDIFAEHTKVGLLPAYRTFGLFRTSGGRIRLFLLFSFDILEVVTVWKVQSLSRFYRSIKEGFNNLHDAPLLLLCTINCAGTLMYFGLLRYIRFASINGDKRILPDVNKVEVLTQLNLTK